MARLELELASVRFLCLNTFKLTLTILITGRNAINILSSLGVYEDVRTRAMQIDSANLKDVEGRPSFSHRRTDDMRGWFKYYSGMGDHEVLSDVSLWPNLRRSQSNCR